MKTVTPNIWPPHYTVIKHPRARRVKLKTSRARGLEVVLPPRFNVKEIPSILAQHRLWIERQLQRLYLESTSNPEHLPDKITFPSLQQTWHIDYQASNTKLKIIVRPHQSLVILGAVQEQILCKKLLQQWVKIAARNALTAKINEISTATKLSFTKLSIRDQSTRWGSCSRDKAISLNYKLIFLPAPLVDHVIVHELCHTVHLNHSASFWAKVASFDPDYQVHKKLLRRAHEFIPGWIL